MPWWVESSGPLLMALTFVIVGVVLAVGAWRVGAQRRTWFIREFGIVIGAYLVYFGVRAFTEGSQAVALDHAARLVEFERRVGLFVEPAIQTAVIGEMMIINAANFVYVWFHWPVIGAVAIWLFTRRPQAYVTYRSALLISGTIGLVLFIMFPAAPPRLANLGLVDTVVVYSTFGELLQPTELTNQYAAFPSLHFGWNLLMGIALVSQSRFYLLRVLGVLLPLAMFIAIVITANHYVIDAVAGGAIAVLGLLLARRIHAGGRWVPFPTAEGSGYNLQGTNSA